MSDFKQKVLAAISQIAQDVNETSNLTIKEAVRTNGEYCTQSEVREIMKEIVKEYNIPILRYVPYKVYDITQLRDDEDDVENGWLFWHGNNNPIFVSVNEYESVGKARVAYAKQYSVNYNTVRRKTIKND